MIQPITVRYDQPWLTSLLRPTLIAVMIACVDLTLLSLIARFAPFLANDYIPTLIVISVGAGLVGCITTTWLAQPTQRQRRTTGFRLAELGLILALTRLAIWAVTGSWPTPDLFFVRPSDALFDGLFWVGGFVVTLSWVMATNTTDDLLRMALQPDELYAVEADRIGELVRTSHMDRPAILRGLVGRWVGGGLFMVILAAGLGVQGAGSFFILAQQNIRPGVIIAIIVYFLAGLLLISHGQLALLRSRWTIDRVPSAPAVLRNWPLYVLILLLALGVIALLLPFGGTFYLAQILGTIIALLFGLMLDFFRLLNLLFVLLISLLGGEAPPAESAPPPQPPPAIERFPPVTQQAPGWVGGIAFWLTMALLLGYAAYIYFSGRGMTLGWLAAFWHMLLARWAQFRSAYQGWRLVRRATVRREEGTGAEEWLGSVTKRWRLRDLAPDQQVRYLYLATLEHTEKHGLPRKQSETPLQYSPRLTQQLVEQQDKPEAKAPEVQILTEAFVQVRYAQRPAAAEQVPMLQKIWEQIKQHLHL
jgi:hypothetical protein